jgi:peroxiredoxin
MYSHVCVAICSLLLPVVIVAKSSQSLLPSSELTPNCYESPAKDFSASNCVKCTYGSSPHILLSKGSFAIDFTLPDVNGKLHTLSELLLLGKPVLMVWGMYTCPAYQGLGTDKPYDQCSYNHEYDLVEQYKDRITFLHMYGPEPHPNLPYSNFDSGKPKINYWSTVEQPSTWEERMDLVRKVAPLTHPSALLLVDLLEGSPFAGPGVNNPVWCSYVHGSRAVILIGTDGSVQYTRDWLRVENVAEKLDSYLETL